MAKKGVLRITGNTAPKTGEKAFYKVTEWYPDTPANERNESLITWELFRKRENGKFTTTHIKKKVGEFTFGKDAWQYTYRVEGYLDKPEGKEPMSIIVQPQKNKQQAPQKEKDILGVKLTFQDGTPVNKKLSYRDRLWATAKCQGLEGEPIVFTLWEDDEKGDGHNKKNQSVVKSPPVLVDSQGYARWNFTLLNTYIAIANQREDDKKQHEYYVTAEYNGKIKASDNANADNPEYKAPSTPHKPAGGAKPQPNPDSPKGSTRPHSPNNQPDKKGVITQVKLTDKNGKEFTKNPKFGETIIVHIESKNLVGKKYILKIWEHDMVGNNDLLYNHEHTFLADKINLSMPLTPAMQKTGELGNDKKNPDSGEYWKGGQQEIFAEVIFLNISSKSQTIDVDILETPRPQNNGNTATGVKNQPKPEQKSTCICQEQYKDLVWGGKVSCEFRKKVVQICAELWGENRKIEMANGLMAVMNVETASSFKAHQIMGKSLQDINSITKDDFWLYKKDKTGKIVSKSSRAVGLIQFTQDALESIEEFASGSGFDKLHEVKLKFAKMGEVKQLDYVKKYFEKSKAKIKSPEDIYLHVFAPKGVGKKDDYVLYDKDIDGEKYRQNKSVDEENNNDKKIQRNEILGRYNISFSQGLGNKPKIFKCESNATIPQSSPPKSTKWHDPVDNPMLCLYTQNGNYRPRYNVFGTVRKERSNHNHQGIDFLALPGSNAYACVDAYVEFISIQSGYGNVICLKVKDPKEFLKRKRDFNLQYSNMGEIQSGPGFSFNGDFYLFYAHLQEIEKSLKAKQEISCGTIIGKNGTSGYGQTKDPHLHFEIRSSATGGGLTNRCHPGIFVYYKDENTMSQKEKDYQKEIAQKFWD
ncbi:M23 family metallopeptidase [Chryseobacterium bernardetii]|uniref:M23 family metallopeptidase n=1 Tax=Chryseobacterium bernardetii TaxID=1241978 RepID=A0A3G6T860_9FLAO|nr:M23 family metallopeptidase [Chryseobacterium bernardetii]AZB25491.1 M23 family metallopeptidase [Chryseobacterium bernardetii]